MVAGVCRRLSVSSVVCNAAHMQRNSPGTAHGGPVVLRPVRATSRFLCNAAVTYLEKKVQAVLLKFKCLRLFTYLFAVKLVIFEYE